MKVKELTPDLKQKFKKEAPPEITKGWNPLSKEPPNIKDLEAYAQSLKEDPERLKEALESLRRLQALFAVLDN
jgi:hypothetical protein